MTLRALRRGYLLLEVGIAGAITAVAVSGLLVMMAANRVDAIALGRDMTARGLVARDIERARSRGFAALVSLPAAPVAGLTGTYTSETLVVTGTEVLFGTQASNFKDITVVVTHPKGKTISSASAVVRIYE